MDRQAKWAGIDTSTRTFSICVVDREGKDIDSAELPADAELAKDFLGAHLDTLQVVALETGGTSTHLARSLLSAGYPVKVYDALRIHRFLRVKTNKTDSNDAKGIAEVGRIGGESLRPVYLKPLELALMREKLVTRERFIRIRVENEKAMMSILNTYGVRAAERIFSFPTLQRNVLNMLTIIEENYEHPVRAQIIRLLDLSRFLREQERSLEKEIGRYANGSDVCRRMMAVPGVGPITAVSFVTAVGDPHRFGNVANVGAYLGLAPRIWQTGRYSKQLKISKWGNSLTRKHLHIAARATLNSRKESRLKDWALQIAGRASRKKATVALARKLAVVLLAIWKGGTKFVPEGIQASHEKLA